MSLSDINPKSGAEEACTVHERGMCPVKPEYVVQAKLRVNLGLCQCETIVSENDQRECMRDNKEYYANNDKVNDDGNESKNNKERLQRGMNKPHDRLRPEHVNGTERPTLEGEMNFFYSTTLQRIKNAVKESRLPVQCGQRANKCELEDKPQSIEANNNCEESKRRDKITTELCNSNPNYNLCNDSNNIHSYKRNRTEIAKDAIPEQQNKEKLCITEPDCTLTAKYSAELTSNLITNNEVKQYCSDKTNNTCMSEREEEKRRESQAKMRKILSGKLILAPLTTLGNLPFRRVCKNFGADVTMSEMALAFNLNRMQKSEWALLRRHESEDIFGIQIAVGKAPEAYTFAKAIEASEFKYDFLDINCGCPVDKVVSAGCGCGLWEKKARLRDVVRALCKYQHQPVTIKARIGIDENSPSIHRQISEYEDWGVSAVTIHGRSRKQRYTQRADWEYINKCTSLTSLPIIGNGDIMSWEDVNNYQRSYSQISAHMIGRGALIKPWIFEEIKSGQVKDINSNERLEMLKEFCKFGLAHWGADLRGVMTTRRFLCEWLSFLCRYVPAGLLEYLPQKINERPPCYRGRDDLETIMASDNVNDWIRISELLLGPVEKEFHFTPKHKSNSYDLREQANSACLDAQLEIEGEDRKKKK